MKVYVEEFHLFWKVKEGFLGEVILGEEWKRFPEEETTWAGRGLEVRRSRISCRVLRGVRLVFGWGSSW